MYIKQACNLKNQENTIQNRKKNPLLEPESKMTRIRDITFYKLY